ncbi:hypothetical protein SAMN06297387_102483 [Streptomyces zhaozhouensis]|uniref:Tetratricopeptide repeat-containing protein n=1 Tax=Streptomyces zhaozhouensis TaxID=1300267 RepID=A0A286DQW2_9ACTN|nr:tetratricopeptide repeat protein [Streptomyces zhaozhouensis]SOD61067.1 hypothetical protein SAMN06297387_102483 [Streptomyces zhaozhouensis]
MSTDLFGVRVLDLDRERRRVRFRVFVVYYEPSWGTGELLPEDPSFFFRVLWEAAEDFGQHRFGVLTDLVPLDDFLDGADHRCFVERYERVAVRNHPVSDEDFERLAMFYYERDGGWQDEESLAQGDYDVYVTDARWLESLRIGQSWGTTSYADPPSGPPEDGEDPWEDWYDFCTMGAELKADACFTLGWLNERRGDVEGAAAAYLRVAEGEDRAQRGKGLLYLGRLREAGGDDEAARALYERAERSKDHERYGARYRSRAALRLGALLRRLGDEEGAREAFGRAVARGEQQMDLGVIAEARRLTGAESPAETADRLHGDGARQAALAALAEHHGSAVVELAGRLFAGDFEGAEAAAAAATEADDTAAFLVDLAMNRWREYSREAETKRLLELALATGRAAEGYARVVARDGFVAPPRGGLAAAELLTALYDRGDEAGSVALAGAAEPVHPRVAAEGYLRVGSAAGRRSDFARAAEWFRRGAAVEGVDDDLRAQCHFRLGCALRDSGENERAEEAFARAEAGLEIFENAAKAASQRAALAHAWGDGAVALAAWARSALLTTRGVDSERSAAGSARLLVALLTELGAEEAARAVDEAATGAKEESFRKRYRGAEAGPAVGSRLRAASLYGHMRLEAGDKELAPRLLERVAGGQGKHAASAAVTMGAEAHRGGDNAAAREWWRHALAKGDKQMSHRAVYNLGLVAKAEHDLPELLEHFRPIAESQHRQGPECAAHIAELCFWLERWDQALEWYRHTLDRTDDPELVGEAGYRVGRILRDRGEAEAARRPLRRAAASGFAPFAEQAGELLDGAG